jgi:hypothetical protein
MKNLKSLLSKIVLSIGKIHWKEKAQIQIEDKEKNKRITYEGLLYYSNSS